MLYREIMAVCSEIHTKHINTVRGQNGELLNVKLAVYIVTAGLKWVKEKCCNVKGRKETAYIKCTGRYTCN